MPRIPLTASFALCALPGILTGQAGAPPPGSMHVSGYIQPRFEANGDSALFKVRRLRLGALGRIASWATYKAQVELRSGGTGATAATVSATDLYVALARGRWGVTIGQSKTPFSVEFGRTSSVLELPERSMIVDSLAPNRDVGVKAQWDSGGRVALQVGIFNGDGVNRAANRDGRFLYMGRAVIKPTAAFELGVSSAAKPDTTTWGVEAVVERARVTARAEYLRRRRAAADVTTSGWYALATYGLVARRIQVAGRVQRFDPNDATSGDRVTGYTAGAQYFFAGDDLKLQVEYTVFDEQGPSVSNNRVIVQMQARF